MQLIRLQIIKRYVCVDDVWQEVPPDNTSWGLRIFQIAPFHILVALADDLAADAEGIEKRINKLAVQAVNISKIKLEQECETITRDRKAITRDRKAITRDRNSLTRKRSRAIGR